MSKLAASSRAFAFMLPYSQVETDMPFSLFPKPTLPLQSRPGIQSRLAHWKSKCTPAPMPLRKMRPPGRRIYLRFCSASMSGRCLGGRPARRTADAVERRRQLREHAVADPDFPLSVPDAGDDARRMGRVQSLAGADGVEHPGRI